MHQKSPQPGEQPSTTEEQGNFIFPIYEGRQDPAVPCASGCSGKGLDQKGQNQLSDYVKETVHFPALQARRELGRIPAGQGNAFSRQASWNRCSLPMAWPCVSLLMRGQARSVCCLQAHVPRRAELPGSQGSSMHIQGKLSTGL